MINVSEQFRNELMWNQPIIHKDVTFHPVLMADSFDFYMAITALTFDQLQYPDDKIAFKPRLYFLLELFKKFYEHQNPQSIEYNLWICFKCLLSMVFKDQKVGFVAPENPSRKVLTVTNTVLIDGIETPKVSVFSAKDFEEIRRIILIQNDVDFNDEFVHASIKQRMARDAAVQHKSKYAPGTLEDLIDIVFMYTGKDYDYIKSMSIRKFNRLTRRISMYEEYKICKTASLGGFVSFKEEIQPWMSALETTDKYRGLFKEKGKQNSKLDEALSAV